MSATELHPFPFPRLGEDPSRQKKEHMFVFPVSVLGSPQHHVKVMGGWDTVSQFSPTYVMSNTTFAGNPNRPNLDYTYSLRIFATIEYSVSTMFPT